MRAELLVQLRVLLDQLQGDRFVLAWWLPPWAGLSADGKAASPESLGNSSGRGNEDVGRGAMPKANYLIAVCDSGSTIRRICAAAGTDAGAASRLVRRFFGQQQPGKPAEDKQPNEGDDYMAAAIQIPVLNRFSPLTVPR